MSIAPAALCLVLTGCVIGGDVNLAEEDARLDGSVVQIANSYLTSYVAANKTAYGSNIGAYDVNMFVSAPAASTYEQVDPATIGSNVEIEPGWTIVRQVLAADNSVSELTIMVKGVAGYDPTLGDWWFGLTDPQGNPIPDANGKPQVGRLTGCHSCHIPRAGDGYLFGVPAAVKSSS